MEVSKGMQEVVKEYLDDRADKDELFAITYAKPNKNIEECCKYITECAKKNKAEAYSNKEVFGWAVHYYDEDDIKDVKGESCRVVVTKDELSEEDINQCKAEAMRQVTKEEKEKILSNVKVNLSPEDYALAKERAIALAVEEAKNKMLEKKKKPIVTSTSLPEAEESIKEEKVQGSLF